MPNVLFHFSVSLHDCLASIPLKRLRIFVLKEKYLLFEIYLLLSLIFHWVTMRLCQKPNHLIEFQIHNMNNSQVTYCVGITDKPGNAKKVSAPSSNINDYQWSTRFQSLSKFDWPYHYYYLHVLLKIVFPKHLASIHNSSLTDSSISLWMTHEQ